jgi:tRNA A-37 threonylcarbamoyl transferase component Bud32
VHGIIFFYIQKFADMLATATASHAGLRSTIVGSTANYLPSGVYDDGEAVALLHSIADGIEEPVPGLLGRFGEFLAPHLVKVAGPLVDPSWRTLDLIEHTESLIHSMVRTAKPGAEPPVLETVRVAPEELHLVYSSRRRLCPLAAGLIRGMARHFGETLDVEETSCMHRGDPFCTFNLRRASGDAHSPDSLLSETVVMPADGVGSRSVSIAIADDPMPERIGGYEILGLVGSGAMGRVYLARDTRLDRRVAIKVMKPAKARDPAARRRFIRESQAAAAVEHPHVMTIHQVDEDRGLPFIVMQFLHGDTLAAYGRGHDRLPLREVVRIGREVAEGLAAAHRCGLVHRDIKPDNIFLEGEARTVRIIDFGLARDFSGDPSTVTVDGALIGTPAYMPPERIGSHDLDAKSDLFGLGVILYELLAGRLPFEGQSMVAMLAAISRGGPLHLRDAAPDVPAGVADIVMRLIAHDKADRPADAPAVGAELAAIERSLPAG